MEGKMKRLFTALLAIMMVLSCTNVINANDINIKKASDQIVKMFLDDLGTESEVLGATPLYDGSDRINGYWYHLKNGNYNGYMIVFNWKGELKVTEFSLKEDLNLNKSSKIYYNGLLSYFSGRENSMNVFGEDLIINKQDLYIAPEVDINRSIDNTKTDAARASARISQSWLSHSIPLINQGDINSPNRWSLCTQTASAMLIEYYDKYVSGYSALASKSGPALALEIYQEHMGLTGGVTTLNGLQNGLLSYIDAKGFTGSVYIYKCIEGDYTMPSNYINTIYSDIMNDRPGIVIIGCSAVQANGEKFPCTVGSDCSTFLHAMTITGTYSIGNNDYLDVADPDGGNSRTLLWDTYEYPGEPSAVYATARVIIRK